jgi:RHS repeat-associated protein
MQTTAYGSSTGDQEKASDQSLQVTAPNLALPKGGGALRGIGEKFTANPVTGTGSLTVPISVSPGRAGFGPQLTLTYDSGSGNGPFGVGWNLSLPSITRRTDRGLPQYQDAAESDIFILSGAEDLVPALIQDAQGQWTRDISQRDGYTITRYRPRIEGLFARIERWTRMNDGDTYWRSISKDNITTLYGSTSASRVAHPSDPNRIFTWLISESHDAKGNAIIYEYLPEDSSNIDLSQANEQNRTDAGRAANRYLKRIKYGNLPSLLIQPDITQLNWLFEVVFDYGEGHYTEQPPDPQGRVFATASINPAQTWPVRQDPFSRYRSCFEVRTYRLCRRVLMFHHFPNELGVQDYLVRATEFSYDETPIASFITGVTQSGFVRQGGTFLKRSLPTIEFEYSQAQVEQEVKEVDPESLANIPGPLDSSRYQWLDLDGEGLQSILAEQDDGWYYKRNLSPLTYDFTNGQPTASALFAPLSEVTKLPAFAEVQVPRHQFLDLAGDGQLDCVILQRPVAGFYKRTEEEDWETFRPLSFSPNVDWNDPNLRFIDVDGDGHADVLITENEVLTWFPSLAEDGFGGPIRVPKARDEEEGPAIVFADPTQSIFLADMSGDGLTDIVRIRNGEVCYWPNLGYGQFGPKVAMDQAPWFDSLDQFDPRRIRLADVDGSGVADLIYIAPADVRIYFNEAGNAWSSPESLADFPPVDDLSKVQALDLLGNGTACLVWTSPLPSDVRQSMRYIDLMGGEKPYLLIRSRNNLGAETRVFYAPSTKFYLEDRRAGQPWVTRLPFPVQVVERVETYDWISRNRFVTRYAYHHGYYDGTEREFRGFGMVEQRDTEELGVLTQSGAFPNATNIDAASYVPPTLTKTWFDTGAYPIGPRITRIYDTEYWKEPGLSADQANAILLPDSPLDPSLTGDEIREALRSLKGAMLHQEVYALDGTPSQALPYTVSERNYTVNRLQPFGGNRHAVFFTHARESLDLHYDRTLYPLSGTEIADPRITHEFVLEVDDFGNEQKSVSIGYGRKYNDLDSQLTPPDQAVQSATLITYKESTYTNSIQEDDAYRTPLPAEIRTYQLTGYTASGSGQRFQSSDFVQSTANGPTLIFDSEIPYEAEPTSGKQRRMIALARTLYRKDDLTAPLPLGVSESLALPFISYKMALTPGLLSFYQRGTENLLPTPANILKSQGGYVLGDDQVTAGLFPVSDPTGTWWIPSGQVFYSPGANDSPAQELATAQANFFLGRRYRDPFGTNTQFVNDTIITYDSHDLLTVEVRDAVKNLVTSVNDYRVLQPSLLTDPNNNQSAAAFDALGLVVGTVVMGKTGELLGDTLTGFTPDLIQSQIDAFFADPKGPVAAALLGSATSRIIYDVVRFARLPSTTDAPLPVYAATVSRETHVAALGPGRVSSLQVNFSYSDGLGREIQRKAQAEPGPLLPGGATVNPRWVGSGWIIYNNKGKPVRQYEPFFDNTHDFKFGATVGVSPTLFYDPVDRVVATLYPDHSWEKVVFDPWKQVTWDRNDTVLIDPTIDQDVADFFQRIPSTDYSPTWYSQQSSATADPQEQAAAQKTAVHANTPTTVALDTLGRAFLSIAYNRYLLGQAPPVEAHYRTVTQLDVEGNQRSVTDALVRVAVTYDYNMLRDRIRQNSIDAGERWMLGNVIGKPFLAWDSRDHRLRHEYDSVRRPTNLWVQTGTGAEQLAEQAVYGESQTIDDQANNLRGTLYQQFDEAGLLTNNLFDVKGNLLQSSRELLVHYQDPADWSVSPSPAMTGEAFTRSATFDALNRPVTTTTPDSSVAHLTYNEASLLAQVAVNLRGAATATPFVTGITYNAKAQREQIEFGNGATTQYTYDPNTFRLLALTTTRSSDNATLQALSYTYDPVGNTTHIADSAQETLFFNNQIVNHGSDYVYDALYRLIQTQGRELIGLVTQPQTTWDDSPRTDQPLPTDVQAMQNYQETYQYDPVGNFLSLAHLAAKGNWTRNYAYDEPNSPPTCNRLSSTTVVGIKETYTYDAHGNITTMPHLPLMAWDFRDQLQATQKRVANNGPVETTYYVYDAGGQRVRKVTETARGTMSYQRIYIGGFEVYREYGPGAGRPTLERQTLHVMDDRKRIALVETTTADSSTPAGLPSNPTIRYQFHNHLASACLELDAQAAIISYEEYYSYGSTSYQAGPNAAEVGLKRYRYTGKERDEENGFYYHGARYYAPWLGRWISCDPSWAINLFTYSSNNPIRFYDPSGRQHVPPKAGTPGAEWWRAEAEAAAASDEDAEKTEQAIQQEIQLRHAGFDLEPPAVPDALQHPKEAIAAIQARPRPDPVKDTYSPPSVREVLLAPLAGLAALTHDILKATGRSDMDIQNIMDTMAMSPWGKLPKLAEAMSGLRLTAAGIGEKLSLAGGGAASSLRLTVPSLIWSGSYEGRALLPYTPIQDPNFRSMLVDATSAEGYQTYRMMIRGATGRLPKAIAEGFSPSQGVRLGWSQSPKLNQPEVQAALDAVANPSRYHGGCAEIDLLNKTLRVGDDPRLMAVDVRHVLSKGVFAAPPCETCADVLSQMGVGTSVTNVQTLAPWFRQFAAH